MTIYRHDKFCGVCGTPLPAGSDVNRSIRCADCKSFRKASKALVHPTRPYLQDMRARYAMKLCAGGMTLEMVGDLFGVTRERVRQIEQRALDRLLVVHGAEKLRELLSMAPESRDETLSTPTGMSRPSRARHEDEGPQAAESLALLAKLDHLEKLVEKIPPALRMPAMDDDTLPLPPPARPSPVVRVTSDVLELLKPLSHQERLRVMRAISIALSVDEEEQAA